VAFSFSAFRSPLFFFADAPSIAARRVVIARAQ